MSDTRQRILESARDLIYSRSYADVGVAAICDQAQVKKGSFYHFFPSKRDLTLAVLDELLLVSKEKMIADAFARDVPPMARLSRLLEAIYQFQKSIAESTGHVLGCPFGNLAVEMSTQDESIRQKVDGIFRRIQEYIRSALQEAIDAGEATEMDVDVDATTRAMFAYLEGLMLMAKTSNDPELIKQLGPALLNIRISA